MYSDQAVPTPCASRDGRNYLVRVHPNFHLTDPCKHVLSSPTVIVELGLVPWNKSNCWSGITIAVAIVGQVMRHMSSPQTIYMRAMKDRASGREGALTGSWRARRGRTMVARPWCRQASNHNLLITRRGEIFAWGLSSSGELGQRDTPIDQAWPVQVQSHSARSASVRAYLSRPCTVQASNSSTEYDGI